MTTARQAAPRAGYRHQRRLDKQRRFREELLAVGVLLVALLVTVVLLGLQWLHGGQSSSGAGITLLHATLVGRS
jgi:Tfp pilus assembly protein PilN